MKEKRMTTIESGSTYATLINVFTVEPHLAQELAGLLTEATEDVMQHLPGFRSANIHVSTDGTRVVNYAQWDSAEAFAAMQADPSAQVHMRAAAELATAFDPHLFTVESVLRASAPEPAQDAVASAPRGTAEASYRTNAGTTG